MYVSCPPALTCAGLLTLCSVSVGYPPFHSTTHAKSIDDIAGDTKAGVLVGTDRFGNKYYENNDEELPCEFVLGMVG